VWIAQWVKASALVAYVLFLAEERGSTPDADKLDTGYNPFGVDEM